MPDLDYTVVTDNTLLPLGGTMIPHGDDNVEGGIDITSIFENGLLIDGQTVTTMEVATNGYVTLGEAAIHGFSGDLDTRAVPAGSTDAGIWYEFNTERDSIVITWNQVGRFSRDVSEVDTFQIEIVDRGNGDAEVIYRYGDMQMTDVYTAFIWGPPAGINAYSGAWSANFLPFVGAMEDLDTAPGNTGVAGVWQVLLEDGVLVDPIDTASETLVGGDGADDLVGGFGNDHISGLGGDDTLSGSYGADTLWGGDGNDRIDGGGAGDLVLGGAGDDLIVENTAASGDDRLLGMEGNDTIQAGAGGDLVAGQDGDDDLSGGTGNDTIFGGVGNDALNGESGNDSLSGGEGDDVLNGGIESDTLDGGAGNDTLIGDDTHYYWAAYERDLMFGGDGNDSMLGGTGNDTLYGDAGNDTISGGSLDDVVDGGAGDDFLFGGLGHDTLTGGAGADYFFAARGANTSAVITDYNYAEGDALVLDGNVITADEIRLQRACQTDANGVSILTSVELVLINAQGAVLQHLFTFENVSEMDHILLRLPEGHSPITFDLL